MAWYSISLLAFLLVASYASATTLQELCKGSPDANGCVEALKTFVAEDFVLRSEGWWHDVALMQKAMMKASKKHAVELRHKLKGKGAFWDTCVESFWGSGQLVETDQFEGAATELDKCSHSLEGHQGEGVQDVKSLANKASRDFKAINYALSKAKKKPN